MDVSSKAVSKCSELSRRRLYINLDSLNSLRPSSTGAGGPGPGPGPPNHKPGARGRERERKKFVLSQGCIFIYYTYI